MTTRDHILLALSLVRGDMSRELVTQLAALHPMDKAPWMRDDRQRRGAHVGNSSPGHCRRNVDGALRGLVRAGLVVETEPGRYALAEREVVG